MARLQVRPGQSGSVAGRLLRRDGDDFRLEALVGGVEWELPHAKGLMVQLRRCLAPWETCQVVLRMKWVSDGKGRWAAWRLERRSEPEPLRGVQSGLRGPRW